ncbi:ABC transporter substrate-binding protein [Gordonia sp. (in: high G+C Gram-positive bacteria)]|uniref:ABC transporter substrate-binding protein n=1 Tax=Gordonia sp. (in: high G+C Gram-positive bacteria) TaxID=84139 RepID=UPI003F943525
MRFVNPGAHFGAAAAVLGAAGLLTACGAGVDTDRADGDGSRPVTVDDCGRELTFTSAPQRVVGLMPTQTDLLLRLGAGDRLVGQAQTGVSDLPADTARQATDIPVLSVDAPPAREDLLEVEPDFVVAPTSYEFTAAQGFADIGQLDRSGAQAYIAAGGCAERRNSAKVTDVLTDIDNLGAIMRVPDTADRLAADTRERLRAVDTAIEGRPRPSVAQVYAEAGTLTAIGAGVEADIIERAGGANVFDASSPEFADFFAAEINPEEIIARAPDVIVFGVTDGEHEKRTRDYLRRTFPDVPAVRDGRLIAVAESDLHPGTLGNVGAVETIAHGLHPEGA